MHMKAPWSFVCPHCDYRFTWIERTRCGRCLGFARKVVSCPSCDTRLILAKWPFRIVMAASIALMGFGGYLLFNRRIRPAALQCCYLVVLALSAIIMVTICKMRLERVS